MPLPPTPELDKMSKVTEFSQPLGEFLDWLHSNYEYRLCYKDAYDGEHSWEPIYLSLEKILAEYFEIDLEQVEKERRLILEALQMQHLAANLTETKETSAHA